MWPWVPEEKNSRVISAAWKYCESWLTEWFLDVTVTSTTSAKLHWTEKVHIFFVLEHVTDGGSSAVDLEWGWMWAYRGGERSSMLGIPCKDVHSRQLASKWFGLDCRRATYRWPPIAERCLDSLGNTISALVEIEWEQRMWQPLYHQDGSTVRTEKLDG